MTTIQKSISVFAEKAVDAGFLFFCGELKKAHRMFYPDKRRWWIGDYETGAVLVCGRGIAVLSRFR